MRVTVSGNWFGDHDKAMLVDGGPGSDACSGPPGIRLTLFRNRFERTGQRHPRAGAVQRPRQLPAQHPGRPGHQDPRTRELHGPHLPRPPAT